MANDRTLKEIQRILAVVHDACPGLSDATYLLGKAKYLAGEPGAAEKILSQCLDKDQTFSDAHLLMAQVIVQCQYSDVLAFVCFRFICRRIISSWRPNRWKWG